MIKPLNQLLSELVLDDGFTATATEGVHFFKVSCVQEPSANFYDPFVCLVTQGTKYCYVGDTSFKLKRVHMRLFNLGYSHYLRTLIIAVKLMLHYRSNRIGLSQQQTRTKKINSLIDKSRALCINISSFSFSSSSQAAFLTK